MQGYEHETVTLVQNYHFKIHGTYATSSGFDKALKEFNKHREKERKGIS